MNNNALYNVFYYITEFNLNTFYIRIKFNFDFKYFNLF